MCGYPPPTASGLSAVADVTQYAARWSACLACDTLLRECVKAAGRFSAAARYRTSLRHLPQLGAFRGPVRTISPYREAAAAQRAETIRITSAPVNRSTSQRACPSAFSLGFKTRFFSKRKGVRSSPDGPERGRAQGRTAARRPARVGGKPRVAHGRSVTGRSAEP